MDNPQQPTPPTPPVTPAVPPVSPTPPPAIEPQTVIVKKTPMQMIGSLFSGLKPGGSFPLKKVIIIMTIIFVLLMLGIVVVRLLMPQKPPATLEPSPTPEATQAPATPPPTRYATDSAVLEIEANIQTLDKELSEVDIDEVNIKPRTLLWDVNFNK